VRFLFHYSPTPNFEELEKRRMAAARLLAQGVSQVKWHGGWECIGNQ
jgi:hypothetical protein